MKTAGEWTKAKSAPLVDAIWQLFAEAISPFGCVCVPRLPESRSFSLSLAVKRLQLFFSGVILQHTYASSHIQSRLTRRTLQRWFFNSAWSSGRQPPTCWVRWINTPKLMWCLFHKFLCSFQWNSWLCFLSSKFGEVQVIAVLLCGNHLIELHPSNASDHIFF